jgi:hypothetical protein
MWQSPPAFRRPQGERLQAVRKAARNSVVDLARLLELSGLFIS